MKNDYLRKYVLQLKSILEELFFLLYVYKLLLFLS